MQNTVFVFAMYRVFLLFFICLVSGQIQIEKLSVPDTIIRGVVDDVVLDCDFDEGGDDHIIVKWLWSNSYLSPNTILLYQWTPNVDSKGQAMIKFREVIDPNYKASNNSNKMYRALHLTNISSDLSGNYSCLVKGSFSEDMASKWMTVYSPPVLKQLKYYPSPVIKGYPLTLECVLDDPGYPKNISYIWYRGHYKLFGESESKLFIPQASLYTRNNFSCIASNGILESYPKTISVEVSAPPTFIGHLTPYKSFLFSSKNVSLSCWIECYPLCSVQWYKDGHLLQVENNPLYYVKNIIHQADPLRNDFESVESILVWNIENWPLRQLDKNAPLAYYTCASNSQETHINFTTIVAVDCNDV